MTDLFVHSFISSNCFILDMAARLWWIWSPSWEHWGATLRLGSQSIELPPRQQPRLRIKPRTLEFASQCVCVSLQQILQQPVEVKMCNRDPQAVSVENWKNLCAKRVVRMIENTYLDAKCEHESSLIFHQHCFPRLHKFTNLLYVSVHN